MPVNTPGSRMRALSQGSGCELGPRPGCPGRPRRTRRSSSAGRVGAARVHAERRRASGAPVAAEQARRHEERERVDEAGARAAPAASSAPPSTQERGDLARAQQPRAPRPGDPAVSASTPGGGGGAPPARRAGRARPPRPRQPAAAASRPRRSKTTRSGCRSGGRLDVAAPCSSGSSASAVPLPTATASIHARHSCTSARLSGEEIQRLSPAAVAVRPSSDAASLSSTNGRPCTTCDAEARRSGAAPARSRSPAGELDLDAGGAQPREAAPVDLGVGSPTAHDHARDAGLDQRVGAGRLAAVVGAGLERDVRRRPARRRLAAGGERVRLGVRARRGARASPRRARARRARSRSRRRGSGSRCGARARPGRACARAAARPRRSRGRRGRPRAPARPRPATAAS